jgi:hypothetical protein
VKKSRRNKGERTQGTCVYFGAEGPVTDDHVFPQAIFLTLDEQMITVPACDACQQKKSLGDRDLRNYILMGIGGITHPDAVEMAGRMLRESNVRLRNWVRKQIESARQVDLITDTGIVIGTAFEFNFNMDRIMAAQQMVVRGLHFHEKGEMLPSEAPIDIEHIPWHVAPKFVQNLSAKTAMNPKVKGKNVVWWTSHQVAGLPDDSIAWVICYNNWVLFLGTTGDLATRVREMRESHTSKSTAESEVLNVGPRKVVVPRDIEGRPIIPPQ